MVDLDRLLGDEGEDGVRATEGDDRGAGEEQPLVDEDARPAEQQRDDQDRDEPDDEADREGEGGAPP